MKLEIKLRTLLFSTERLLKMDMKRFEYRTVQRVDVLTIAVYSCWQLYMKASNHTKLELKTRVLMFSTSVSHLKMDETKATYVS